MKSFINAILITFLHSVCFAQKAPIDPNVLKKWISVGSTQISNNGAYALYNIENQPLGKHTLVFTDTKKKWKIEIPRSTSNAAFTSDSKYAFFINENDSLGIINLGKNVISYISFVQSFKVPQKEDATYILYQLKSAQKTLVIHDLKNGKKKLYDNVQQYLVSKDGSSVLFISENKKDSVRQILNIFDISSWNAKSIWQGGKAGNLTFNQSGKKIAFTVDQEVSGKMEKTFWYYFDGADKAIEIANNNMLGNNLDMKLENIVKFSEDDSCLFISLKQDHSPKYSYSPVDVWNYKDSMLQSKQLNELYPRVYMAIINIQNLHLIRLERDNEDLMIPSFRDKKSNCWGLIINRPGDPAEENWNEIASLSVFLVSTKDGTRKKIPGLNNLSGRISPKGKYVIYYDSEQKNYFSFETETGITRNITKNIPVLWTGYVKDRPNSDDFPRGIAGWLDNEEAVFIYDENDIWKVDMATNEKAVNVTNGYGKKHKIVFSLDLVEYNLRVLKSDERLILNAFNLRNKDNGYFGKVLSKKGDPELLFMGPYLYNIPKNPYIPEGSNFAPLKALKNSTYLVKRMKGNESPNIFSTSDFKTYTKLSDVHPEKDYNWLTAELVTWEGLDGDSLQGILYKPENFNPQYKYPVIFNYYERKSDGLNAFLKPDPQGIGSLGTGGEIDIPWYTSNGYVVFLPDIHYKIGETGESVINSVVSAAQYLSRFPWINSKKMGIQGISFGGYETNYLVTHTSIFAAACTVSGLSDLVSAYGSIYDKGSSKQTQIEIGYRLGATLWERPDLYIKNSPIFAADNVSTPLLIMHTKQDGTCLFANAIEFFTALRRLGKKVWMLQYDGNHIISGNSAIDFNIRLAQFFDHYLKDQQAPKWMIKGVPAKLKGVDLGLETVNEMNKSYSNN